MTKTARQLTVGKLIWLLQRCESQKAIVWFDFVYMAPDGNMDSYRGYYEDLALGYKTIDREQAVTVEALAAQLQLMLGNTITGYKGGDYTVTEDTAVWVANPGEVGGTAVVEVIDEGTRVVLETVYVP